MQIALCCDKHPEKIACYVDEKEWLAYYLSYGDKAKRTLLIRLTPKGEEIRVYLRRDSLNCGCSLLELRRWRTMANKRGVSYAVTDTASLNRRVLKITSSMRRLGFFWRVVNSKTPHASCVAFSKYNRNHLPVPMYRYYHYPESLQLYLLETPRTAWFVKQWDKGDGEERAYTI